MTRRTCPSCASPHCEPFYEAGGVPVNTVLLLDSREEAMRFPTGAIRLAFCHDCGFIYNSAFEPERLEYSTRCEETQGFSPAFGAWHGELARKLVSRYGLRGKTILEIGCGKGEFLTALCELGHNRGLGFDPAYVPERNTSAARERIEFIQDFYSQRYSERRADFVACKMTLEHIAEVGEFVRMVRAAIGDEARTVVFFQVPDVRRILCEQAFWDVYYEHCSYFSAGSLARLFRRAGYDLLGLGREYGDQYLMLEGRPRLGEAGPELAAETDMAELERLVDGFAAGVAQATQQWRRRIEDLSAAGDRIVVWGSGSKGAAFLTTLGVQGIEQVVDINPHRHDHFMPVTGQRIVGPEALRRYQPTAVVVMNPLYVAEVRGQLSALALHPEVWTP